MERFWRALGAVALAAALGACGGGSDTPVAGAATIGVDGGTLDGPDGVRLVVPAGALAGPTTIRIATDATGAPDLGGARAISAIYAVTPHGQAFASSARISIPFNPADVAPGTRPVLLRAQPGGSWEALATDVIGDRAGAADTPGLSFYALGTCFTTRDGAAVGPDPVFYCPAAHELKLLLLDNSGAEVPLVRASDGTVLPVMTISTPTTIRTAVRWTRPAGTQRTDRLWHQVFGAGLLPNQQPLVDAPTSSDFSRNFSITIDPAQVTGASGTGGRVIRLLASASYTADAFYPGCVCMRPATWTFQAEIPIRVVYTGTTPTITQQPQNQTVTEGQTAAFSVAATGPALSYQWSSFRSQVQTVIPGATQASYTTPPTVRASDDNSLYAVQVCSNRGTTLERCVSSDAAQLRVTAVATAPLFTQAPASVSVVEGQTASFNAVASGNPAPAVTWARVVGRGLLQQLEPVCGTTTGPAGSTAAACTIGPVAPADSGNRYVAIATNAAGNVQSAEAVLTVTPLPVAPSITTPAQPDDRTVTAGQSVTWTVGAAGTAPLSYRWRTVAPNGTVHANVVCANGVDPGQSTGPTLTLPSVPLDCNGYRFEVQVSNGVLPNAVSRRALLTVNPAPAAPRITTALSDRAVPAGTQVAFSVAATGTPATFTYTWTLNGSAVPNPVSGCTSASATCTLTATLGDNGRTVRVVVANGVSPDAASQATLTVTTDTVGATITQQPQSVTVAEGGAASFVVTVAGTPTPTVQWQRSSDGGATWVSVPGATATTLTLASVTTADTGLQVRAVATNTVQATGGSQVVTAASNAATLTVTAAAARSWRTAALLQNSAFQTEGAVPDIAADGAGNMFAAWTERTLSGANSIVVARLTRSGGWETPVMVATTGSNVVSHIKVAVNDQGHAALLWLQVGSGTADTVWVTTYTPIGGWRAGVPLDTDGLYSYAPFGLAMDAAGNAMAVWRHDIAGGRSGIFQARFVPATGWTAAAALDLGTNFTAAFAPSVGFDSSGNAVALWMQSGSAGSLVASARWAPGSGWTATQTIHPGPDAASEPKLAVNANGGAAAVWLQGSRVWSNRYTPGSGWGTAVQVVSSGATADSAQVAIDSSGNVLAVWRQSDGSRLRIWGNRLAVGGAWGTPVALSTAGLESYDPALAVNASGQGVAVWRSLDTTVGRYTVYAAVFAPGSGWGAAQPIEPTEQSRPPKVAVDPTGDAAVVWPRAGTNAWQIWSNRYR